MEVLWRRMNCQNMQEEINRKMMMRHVFPSEATVPRIAAPNSLTTAMPTNKIWESAAREPVRNGTNINQEAFSRPTTKNA